MARFVKRKLSKKEQKAAVKTSAILPSLETKREPEKVAKKKIYIPDLILVKDFADKAGLPVTRVITQLIKSGVLATINETIDFETAQIIGDDLNLEVLKEEKNKAACRTSLTETCDKKNSVVRPPIVTIMGHVDHGKTTLLDKIREAKVAESESGGITQHISAYQVTLDKTTVKNLKNRTITFIDTPGHAAFSAMRERGTSITDLIVLIVAANDGVMPQTIEVIEEAARNNVPIIVAINKVDLPDSDVMRVKQQLSEHGLVPEEWGGKTVMVEISAKTGQGVDNLLEMILLQTDLMNLMADPTTKATGTVIESYMQKGSGAVAFVLIENGTLRKGDAIAIGNSYGKVRVMQSFSGTPLSEAAPSRPVQVSGLKSLPSFGDRLLAFDNDRDARDNAIKSQNAAATINVSTAKRIESTETVYERKDLNIILKADVAGSIEAIKKMIFKIDSNEINVCIISEGVGAISESDVTLAHATKATILGFRVNVLGAAKRIADKEKIKIELFAVIYELITKLKEELSALLPPEIIEEELGTGTVLGIFRDDKKGFVAGGIVNSGKIANGDKIKFFQNGNEKYRDTVLSLRREKNEAKEVVSGSECGFGLSVGANVAVGDTFVTYKRIEKQRFIS